MNQIVVVAENFSGPLPLLFKLLVDCEIDVFSIRLAHITRQVVEAILSPDSLLDADDAGAYLVLCAGLLRLKSRKLLPAERQPQPESIEEEIVDEDVLAMEQLLEYQHYRSVAEILGQLAEEASLLYPRGISNIEPVQTHTGLEHVSLMSLVAALDQALKSRGPMTMEIEDEEYTLSQALHNLRTVLHKRKKMHVSEIFPQGSRRLEIIVLFLGLLELIRLGDVQLAEEEGGLYIQAREDGQVA